MFNKKVISTLIVTSVLVLIVWSVAEIQATIPLLIPPKEDTNASTLLTVKKTLEAWGTRKPLTFVGEMTPTSSPSAELEIETIYTIRIVNASGVETLADTALEAFGDLAELEVSEVTTITTTDTSVIEAKSSVPDTLKAELQSVLEEFHEKPILKKLVETSSDDIIIVLGVK